MKTSAWALLGVRTPFDPACSLVTSWALPPAALAALRLLLALYGTAFVLARLVYEGVHDHSDASFFSYFTDLSYVGLLAYNWAAGAQTLAYARSLRSRPHAPTYPLQAWPRALQLAHVLLQSSVLTFPFLVTAVFWGLLSGPATLATRYGAWVNVSEHALNAAFAALELALGDAAPGLAALPWAHLPLLVGVLACYLGVAYVTHATQGFYTYSFLDPHAEGARLAAYIVGVAAAEGVLFVLVRYAMLARSLLVRRARRAAGATGSASVSGRSRKESGVGRGGDVEALEDWEEVGRPSGASGERGVAL